VHAKLPLQKSSFFAATVPENLAWRGGDDVNDRLVGNPKRRCDEHSSKFSLSKKPRFINLVGKSQTQEGDAC
jgi:hypothetical protein